MCNFLLDILFICISNFIPFPSFPSVNLLSHSPSPCFYEGAPPSTYPLPGIPLHWGIEPSQAQWSLLPLMSDKVILCYICSWSLGPTMCCLWLASLGALGILVVWYGFSFYEVGHGAQKEGRPSSVLLRRGNKILKGGNMETKCGAETEGKAIQRLPLLGIHPIYSHQT